MAIDCAPNPIPCVGRISLKEGAPKVVPKGGPNGGGLKRAVVELEGDESITGVVGRG